MSAPDEPAPATDPCAPGVRASDVPIVKGGRPPFGNFAEGLNTASDIDISTVTVTFFSDAAAQSLRTEELTLPELTDVIAKQTASTKAELPLLKLAVFGKQRSEKLSLRTNANVLQITGIEVEHDVGDVSFDTALAVMRRARIACLIYTTPSYVPGDSERWRIIVPLSQHREPSVRENFVARINGLLGGKLAPESFALSQAYYYGHINNPNHRVEVIDGDYLDLRDDTYAGSIYKNGRKVSDQAADEAGFEARNGARADGLTSFDRLPLDAIGLNAGSGRSDEELQALLEASLVPGNWHNCMRSATATMVGRGWTDSEINFACEDYCTGRYGDADLKVLIEGARKRFNKPNPVQQAASQQKPPTGIKLDYYENFETAVVKDWIVKGVIAKGETSSIIGPPGVAKSALLVDLMISVASGADWRGYRSKGRVGVVYFALERAQLVKRRLMAHAMRSPEPQKLPIAVANQVINLVSADCVAMIVETIRTAEAHYGCSVGLIVIDTFNKGIAAGGGDENSAKDQNMTLANLRRVQEQTGVHIALVAHAGKDEGKGARGSNAQLGDVDLMVQIADADGVRTATIIKNNDGAAGVLTVFKLEVVTLDIDDDGDDVTTAIVSEDRLDSAKAKSRAQLNPTQRKAMEMLERALIDCGVEPPKSTVYPPKIKVVSVETWRDICWRGGLSPAGTPGSFDKAFRRAMRDLDALKRIGVWDDWVWIAYD